MKNTHGDRHIPSWPHAGDSSSPQGAGVVRHPTRTAPTSTIRPASGTRTLAYDEVSPSKGGGDHTRRQVLAEGTAPKKKKKNGKYSRKSVENICSSGAPLCLPCTRRFSGRRGEGCPPPRLTSSAPTVTPIIRKRTPQPALISVSESSEDTHMSPTGSYPLAMSSGIPCRGRQHHSRSMGGPNSPRYLTLQ